MITQSSVDLPPPRTRTPSWGYPPSIWECHGRGRDHDPDVCESEEGEGEGRRGDCADSLGVAPPPASDTTDSALDAPAGVASLLPFPLSRIPVITYSRSSGHRRGTPTPSWSIGYRIEYDHWGDGLGHYWRLVSSRRGTARVCTNPSWTDEGPTHRRRGG